MVGSVQPVAPWSVALLELDDQNPRLPEELRGQASQADLLRHFERDYDLDELGWSLAEKGYYVEEPLLTIAKPNDSTRQIVIEGNRRLAALKLLTEPASRAAVPTEGKWTELAELAADQVLDEVPTRQYEQREDLLEYLGFRHVSGLLEWTAEAKARYVHTLIQDHEYTFATAARVIGSRADAIRRQFVAWRSIEQGRAADIDVQAAVAHFGVYYRSLQNPGIRGFLGLHGWLDGTETLQEPLQNGGVQRLAEFIDLVFGPRRVIRDSRELDEIGRVAADSQAMAVLRETRDLRAATEELPADRDAIFAAVRLSYRHAARANAEAWQFRGDGDLQAEVTRLFGLVQQLQRSLAGDSAEAGLPDR